MRNKILFVLFICVVCASEKLLPQQGLSEADRQRLMDAIKADFEKNINKSRDEGRLSKEDADKILKAVQQGQAASEKRYQELQAKKAAAPIEWTEFTSKEGGFAVLFPGTPIVNHLAEESGMVHHKFSHRPLDEDLVVGVEYYELPKNADKGKLEGLLDQFRNQFLRTGALRSEKSLALGGNPGKELVFDFSKIQATSKIRLYQTKDRLYQLMCVVQPNGAEIPQSANKFFDSFRLTENGMGIPASVALEPVSKTTATLQSATATASSLSDRKQRARTLLRAAAQANPTEISAQLVTKVEQALESRTGEKLNDLLTEIEELRDNTPRNQKNFKRYWIAEGDKGQ